MNNPGKNPVDTLRQEILADAGRQAERILRKARQDADDLKAAGFKFLLQAVDK
jgi:vacuolar-type H+-ATPase subunit E/Vma4